MTGRFYKKVGVFCNVDVVVKADVIKGGCVMESRVCHEQRMSCRCDTVSRQGGVVTKGRCSHLHFFISITIP